MRTFEFKGLHNKISKNYEMDRLDIKTIEHATLMSMKEVVASDHNTGNIYSIQMLFTSQSNGTRKDVADRIIFRTLLRLRKHLNKPILLLKKIIVAFIKQLIKFIRNITKTFSTDQRVSFLKYLEYSKANSSYRVSI